MEIKFTVPAIPVAQPRQRHRIVSTHGKTLAMNYTPKTDPVNAFKAACQVAASAAYSGAPMDCPISMDVVFVFPRPMSVRKKDGTGRLPHTTKPDRDNLMKSLQDALNGLTYRDDSLICAGHVEKWKAAADEQPHVEVTIRKLVI